MDEDFSLTYPVIAGAMPPLPKWTGLEDDFYAKMIFSGN
jgi:hypothetical protein